MSDGTKIEWADATANYVNGCSVVSPGCTNCYAMRLAGTRMKHHPTREGLTIDTKAGPVWNGTIRTNDKVLAEVLGWKRPRRIFWNAHGDLFHGAVPDEVIDRQFAVMALTPQHIHMVLTKRPDRMREYFADVDMTYRVDSVMEEMINERIDPLHRRSDDLRAIAPDIDETWPLPNVWLGTSVEDQARADERIPALLATPAAVRFISAEPLLGPVELGCIENEALQPTADWNAVDMIDAVKGEGWIFDEEGEMRDVLPIPKIDWVIVGGESGPNARPMHPDWARSLRDQCADAGVPFHFKQWGEWAPTGDWYEDHPVSLPLRCWSDGGWTDKPEFVLPDAEWLARVGKARAGRLLDGVQHDGFPS